MGYSRIHHINPTSGTGGSCVSIIDLKGLTGRKVILVGKKTELDAILRNPKTRHQVECVFQPRWDALVQWLRVLKPVSPLYANIIIDQTEPVEVFVYMNDLFDFISVGEHPDVVASERMLGADIANPETCQHKKTWP